MVHIFGKTKKFVIYSRMIDGKFYVGRASGKGTSEEIVILRAGENGIRYRCCPKLWKAIQKCGWKNCYTKVLAECSTLEEAKHLETYFIYKHDSFRNGYNDNTGEGDKDYGEALYYGTLDLFGEPISCKKSTKKKNTNSYNQKFVDFIVENKISGKKRIRIYIKKWGIVESSLTHYYEKSSDPCGNRFNQVFRDLWLASDNTDEPLCSIFELN